MTTTEGNAPGPTTAEIGGVGHNVKRKEDERFIQGGGQYIEDISLPGMLHLALLRSPLPHARIVNIDTSAAAAARCRRGRDRRGARRARPRLDADPVG